uniref:Uncharacterized protein n=1 Tax=Strongyloides venezuelensis TaxID=75913 RepID=A0A0K0F2Y7_STRVS
MKYLQNTFSTLCEDIKKRRHYTDKPLSQEEANFPIAYIISIYMTNRKLVEVLKIYNGSIDIEYADPRPHYNDMIDFNLNWPLRHLEIFKEGDPRKLNNKILLSQLEFQKGYVTISYPKKSVKYLTEKLNLTKFFKQLDDMNLYANEK